MNTAILHEARVALESLAELDEADLTPVQEILASGRLQSLKFVPALIGRYAEIDLLWSKFRALANKDATGESGSTIPSTIHLIDGLLALVSKADEHCHVR